MAQIASRDTSASDSCCFAELRRSFLLKHWIARPGKSSIEEPLGQRGNKRDLDDQPYQSLNSRGDRQWIIWGEGARGEPPSMKRGHTHNDGFIPRKMGIEIEIKSHKRTDHQQIGKKTAPHLVAVARNEKKKPGKEPGS